MTFFFSPDLSEKTAYSLEKACSFIRKSLNSKGLWSDFLTLAGESTYWVSGYVGYALAQNITEQKDWLTTGGAALSADQNLDGGWGYTYGVPSDADSTSWCLLFLSKLGLLSAKNKDSAVNFLLKHQNLSDGGFRTYANPTLIARYMEVSSDVSFEGWSSSQLCVTGTVAQALFFNKDENGVNGAINFIRKNQSAEGFWTSYWWNGNLYATGNCMRALKLLNNHADSGLIADAQEWIAKNQLPDGSWASTPDAEQGSAFQTALAIKGLSIGNEKRFLSKVASGANWLLSNQNPDGSWRSDYILRIPHPSKMNPWAQPIWVKDGKAVNALIKDQNRLFTTATVYSALTEIQNVAEEL